MKKMLIRFTTLFSFLAIGGLILVAAWLWANNSSAELPTADALNASRQRAIKWLIRHENRLLGSLDFPTWKRIEDSNDLLGDPRLQALISRFHRSFDRYPISRPYAPFFDAGARVPEDLQDNANFKISDLHWFYLGALSCDRKIFERNRTFLQPSHCGSPFLPLSACPIGHLIGFIYMKQRACEGMGDMTALVKDLQSQLERQLIFLPMSGRTYVERVLTLIESGAGDSVKPIWIRNCLERQEPDGGWGGFRPIIPMGNGTSFGFMGTLYPAIQEPESTFSDTARGLLLVSRMLTLDYSAPSSLSR